jgi:CPA1 family monovalent cation:H+ antiporter
LIVLTAFAVVLGTLVIQGLTLKPLMRAFDVRDDDPVGREVAAARVTALEAGLMLLDREDSATASSVREEFSAHFSGRNTADGSVAADAMHGELHRRALAAARDAVLALRASRDIGDDAFHRLEEELDWLEMAARKRED